MPACLQLDVGFVQALSAWMAAALLFQTPASRAADATPWDSPDSAVRRHSLPAPPPSSKPGFKEMPADQTGLDFVNRLAEADALANQNLTFGSGVAAGDYDGDGRCDLYFCAIKGRNGLFRNLGDWRFENVTAPSSTALEGNTNTGAAFADLDGDGDLDLLVTSLGNGVRLLVNQGNGAFRETTRAAGLGGVTGSLTLAIADVEGDGDLDVYVCNYGAMALLRSGDFFLKLVDGKLQVQGPNSDRIRLVNHRLIELGEPDVLYLNQGTGTFAKAAWNSATFVDVQGTPMPAPMDFGLAAQFRDVNGNGAPDLYVCNDFDTPDRFWLNDGQGRFRERAPPVLRSESYSAMGVDFADIDRDGHLDLFVVEMLSPDHRRRLTQRSPLYSEPPAPGPARDRVAVPRNTLFHARGDGTFEEVAHFAGLAASDWSWQGAFLDVDLDGFEDVLVVNGHFLDILDLDAPSIAPGRVNRTEPLPLDTPKLFTPNRAWLNRGDLTMDDRSDAWGFNNTNICHGLALADLDGDGDLDAAINCLNAPALLLRNESPAPRVAVRLRGRSPNTDGLGSKLTLHANDLPLQTREMTGGGKYLSHDQTLRVFAAPTAPGRDYTLEVAWRSGARSIVPGILPGTLYEMVEPAPPPAPSATPPLEPAPAPWFADASALLAHDHHEEIFDDFALQPLLPRKLSQRGPGVCVMDVNGDGHDDVILGTGRGGYLAARFGDGMGAFTKGASDLAAEDNVLALSAWASDTNGVETLSTSAAFESGSIQAPLWRHRWSGTNLVSQPATLREHLYPQNPLASCLAVADFDADGDLDVFLGAHSLPGQYPLGGPSQLLRSNDGVLKLDDVHGPDLLNLGMVNSALWTDLNQDGWPELVVACEWGPVRFLHNDRGRLKETTIPSRLHSHTGWWTGLASADVNGDGLRDLIAGNWGYNGPERATPAQPLRLFFGDFMERQVMDLLETEYIPGSQVPWPSRNLLEMGTALPILHSRYSNHRAWAEANAGEILAPYPHVGQVAASTLATTLFLNQGGRFEAKPLPREAQLAPVWGIVAADFDGNGTVDLFLSQNLFAVRLGQDRMDAGRGLLLRGDGRGAFHAVPGQESGLLIYGDQRGAALGDFNEDGRADLVVTQNRGPSRLFLNQWGPAGLRVRLRGPIGNPQAIGAAAALWREDQTGIEQEIQGGGGWLSQNSTTLLFPKPDLPSATFTLRVRWPGGRTTQTPLPKTATRVTVDEAGRLVE